MRFLPRRKSTFSCWRGKCGRGNGGCRLCTSRTAARLIPRSARGARWLVPPQAAWAAADMSGQAHAAAKEAFRRCPWAALEAGKARAGAQPAPPARASGVQSCKRGPAARGRPAPVSAARRRPTGGSGSHGGSRRSLLLPGGQRSSTGPCWRGGKSGLVGNAGTAARTD